MSLVVADREGAAGSAEANDLAAAALVRGLVGDGAAVVASPGSRNTALLLAFDACPEAELHVLLDERAAGFFALGLARESRRPVILCCTSGSAAGHYTPAVMEASESGVPLVVVTANRPPERHHCGEAQTAPQAEMFAPWVRASRVLAVPDETLDPRRVLALAAALRAASLAGPVHLDVPMRKPLTRGTSAVVADAAPRIAIPHEASPATVAGLVARLRRAERGVIVAGPMRPATVDPAALRGAVQAMVRATGWPVLADPASGLRYGETASCHYDLVLRHPAIAESLAPDVVLQLGGAPTSKATQQWLERHAAGKLVVLGHDLRYSDPGALASDVILGEPSALLTAAAASLAPSERGRAHAAAFRDAEARVRAVLADDRVGFQGDVARAALRAVPRDGVLHVASSLAIRQLDAFGGPLPHPIAAHASRGVNGIDGTLATFLGEVLAARQPGVALLGDLAFLHDLDGLAAWAQHGVEAAGTAVVIDNRGGRIFELLPIAQQLDERRFERLFATPQRLDIPAIARGLGHRVATPRDLDELRAALAEEVLRPGLGVIHVTLDPAVDRAQQAVVLAAVQAALAAGGEA
ncbi:MAG: 2-succinyl-5-enolpyruvyl-6-hydroxy-3-cyclohexene-1-carboxylic-acid synthase [Polyangiaceae bacterium]